jgi:hypothetical protein
MPFVSPHANFHGMLLNDRHEFPWISLRSLEYEDPVTGELYIVPNNFRTDGASVPKLLLLIPVIGQALALRFWGSGIWLGFREGVLHDYLIRYKIVPPRLAHRIFRTALYEAGYPPDLCELYYAAVVAANPN